MSILGRKQKSPFDSLDKVSELGLGNFLVEVRNIIVAAETAWKALPESDQENLVKAVKEIGGKLGPKLAKAAMFNDLDSALEDFKAFVAQSPRLQFIMKELTK